MKNRIYKVVETSTVTDDILEEIINKWVGDGWELEEIKFVTREGSRRPGMAFVLFIKDRVQGTGERVQRTEDRS